MNEFLILIFALIGIMLLWVIISSKRSMAYVFCNATISTWEARLLSEARLTELAEAPSLANVLTALEDTDYRTQLAESTKSGELEIVSIERALKESVNARYRELLNMVPNGRKDILLKLLQKTDLENLKALISMIHEKVPKEQRLRELIPSPTMPNERLEMLASADDLTGLLDFLKGSEYFEVISSALEDYRKHGLLALLSALDKHYYTSLWRQVQAKRDQRSVLKAMIGYEVDSINIKLILRLKSDGIPTDEINRYLLKPGHELTEDMLKAMMAAEDIRSAIHMIHITTYGKFLADALPQIEEQGIPAAERALEQGQLKLYKWLELSQFFSIAPVISFIYLKENEMKNLRIVIRLKADGVEPKIIKEKIRRVPKIGA